MPSDTTDPRRHAPATLRNRDALLEVLRRHLPKRGTVLEIASGSGEHAAYFIPRLAETLTWQPSDPEAGARVSIDAHAGAARTERIAPALALDVMAADWPVAAADAIFCANMIHIAPLDAVARLMGGAGRILPAGGPLILYGPFRRHGDHTAPSNEAFDDHLRMRDPRSGVRDLEGEVLPQAKRAGLALEATEAMPANNLTVVFRKRG
jgi:hypothetical protein